MEHRDPEDLQVHLDHRVLSDQLEALDQPEVQVRMDYLDLLVPLVYRVQQDSKDQLETKDPQGPQVTKVQQDRWDLKDNLAHKDHLVLQGLMDSKGQLGLLVPKGHQVSY